MGKTVGVLALVVALASTAHADRLTNSRLDVSFPVDWSVFYPEKIPVFAADSFTFSILAGAGLDGVGKDGDPMKLHVPYAVSGQAGARLAVADFEAEASLAVRAKADDDPGSAARATLRRRWFARRLSSVGVSYFKYGDTAGRVEVIIDFRL